MSHIIKIPEKANMAGIIYTVREDKDEVLEAKSSLGEIDYGKREIYLLSTLDKNRKVKIFLHELAHGILFESGHIRRSADEDLVDILTNSLFGLFIDNRFVLEEGE